MTTINIDGKEFKVPEDCYHVAIDFDGKIHAYEKQPTMGNTIAGCWLTTSYGERPGVIIGDLDRIVPEWKDSLFSIMQTEHSVNHN